MADGLKTELQYDFGTCGECNYTVEEVVQDHPAGAPMLEATAKVLHVGEELFMIVIPHRTTCSLHTNQHWCV
jgi:hypothetical protein